MRRVAVVHDWLTGMRGGERVLEALLELFPDAEIFTLVHVPGSVSPPVEARRIHVSPLGRLPGAGRAYRWMLPLMPAAVERFDLAGFDLVVSSSHCVAKGVRPPPGVPHVCYCHTPMRYVWDQFEAYFGAGRASWPARLAMAAAAPRLRAWDRKSAGRVTRFVANSAWVRDRIRRFWSRDASVVHPPVDTERFRPAGERTDEYVCLGALVPYKRVDLVVDAFTALGRPLRVVGDGPEMERLRVRAGSNVVFTGRLPDDDVADLLGRCRALVHAGVEDFGITLVEAQAAGAPVVALGRGGALETVVDPAAGAASDGASPTGVLFPEQTVEAVVDGVRRLDAVAVDPDALRAHAAAFGRDRFLDAFRGEVEAALAGMPEPRRTPAEHPDGAPTGALRPAPPAASGRAP